MSIVWSCDLKEINKQKQEWIYSKSKAWLQFNQADSIFKEYDWLESANRIYKQAWGSKWMQDFKMLWNWDNWIAQKIWSWQYKDFSTTMQVWLRKLYNEWPEAMEKHLKDFWLWEVEINWLYWLKNWLDDFSAKIWQIENPSLRDAMQLWVRRMFNQWHEKEWTEGWGRLTNFFSLNNTSYDTNILKFIAMFQPDIHKELINRNLTVWTSEKYFGKSKTWLDKSVPHLVANAYKDYMWDPFVNNQGIIPTIKKFMWIQIFTSWIFSLFWKSVTSFAAFATLWFSSWVVTMNNLKKYKTSRGNSELIDWLRQLWISDWSRLWAMSTFWNTQFQDFTGNNQWYWNNLMKIPAFSWLMMWMQNLVWDTLFRIELSIH